MSKTASEFTSFFDTPFVCRRCCKIWHLSAWKQKKRSKRSKYAPNNARASFFHSALVLPDPGNQTNGSIYENGSSCKTLFRIADIFVSRHFCIFRYQPSPSIFLDCRLHAPSNCFYAWCLPYFAFPLISSPSLRNG